jgi:hypothetical protein
MAEEKTAVPKEAVPDTADTIVTRIEDNVAKMHTASPSGTEAIQAELTADLEKLRATAPPPDPPARAAATSHKAKAADDDDDEEEEKHGRGKRK